MCSIPLDNGYKVGIPLVEASTGHHNPPIDLSWQLSLFFEHSEKKMDEFKKSTEDYPRISIKLSTNIISASLAKEFICPPSDSALFSCSPLRNCTTAVSDIYM